MRKKDLRVLIEHINSVRDKTSEELKREAMRRDEERQRLDFEMRKAEIASKDRVDISLDEYKRTMDEIASLESQIKGLREEIDYLENILKNIGVPNNLISKIMPDSIKVSSGEDIINGTRRIRVEFDIDEASLREVY